MMYYCRQADFSPSTHLKRVLATADAKILRMLNAKGLHAHKKKWWVIVPNRRNEPQRLVALWEKQKRLQHSRVG